MMKMQIGKMIFEKQLSMMKATLRMGEFKFGRDTDSYKYFKEQVMDTFYKGTLSLLRDMEKNGLLKKCQCHGNLREGYQDCSFCSGCGYCNYDTEF